MGCRTTTLFAVAVLCTVACGPPRFDSEAESGEGDSTGEDPTSSTTETGVPTTDPSGGISFLQEEDDLCPLDCDPFAQDCPEGEKCVPYASSGGTWDAHKCVPIMGDQGVGETCTYGGVVEATDDCDATSFCWDAQEVDGELIGTCHALCLGSADTPVCPPSSQCWISGDGTITLCIPTCDPLLQNCDDGLACFWTNSDFNCVFTTQDIPIGEPCGFINDCAKGLMCLNGEVFPACEGSACCGAFCDLELGDAPCEAALPGTACVSFFIEGEAPPEYQHVGVCILPQP